MCWVDRRDPGVRGDPGDLILTDVTPIPGTYFTNILGLVVRPEPLFSLDQYLPSVKICLPDGPVLSLLPLLSPRWTQTFPKCLFLELRPYSKCPPILTSFQLEVYYITLHYPSTFLGLYKSFDISLDRPLPSQILLFFILHSHLFVQHRPELTVRVSRLKIRGKYTLNDF